MSEVFKCHRTIVLYCPLTEAQRGYSSMRAWRCESFKTCPREWVWWEQFLTGPRQLLCAEVSKRSVLYVCKSLNRCGAVRLSRPKGRSHIMVPCGGANSEGWLAFRDALSRIEAYTSQAAPAQVSAESPPVTQTVSQPTTHLHACILAHTGLRISAALAI